MTCWWRQQIFWKSVYIYCLLQFVLIHVRWYQHTHFKNKIEIHFITWIGMWLRYEVWQVCQELSTFIFVKLSHQGALYLLLNLLTHKKVCPWIRSVDSFHANVCTVKFCSLLPCFITDIHAQMHWCFIRKVLGCYYVRVTMSTFYGYLTFSGQMT